MATQLEKLKEQEKRLKARIRNAENRVKTEDRKRETRRKIIIGGAILAELNKGNDIHIGAGSIKHWLANSLTRDDDRGVFDLPKLGNEGEN